MKTHKVKKKREQPYAVPVMLPLSVRKKLVDIAKKRKGHGRLYKGRATLTSTLTWIIEDAHARLFRKRIKQPIPIYHSIKEITSLKQIDDEPPEVKDESPTHPSYWRPADEPTVT